MPHLLESEQHALTLLIQIATILSGKDYPPASMVLAMLKESRSVEVSLAPIDAEPGLDSIIILNFQLKELPPCR